MVREIAEIRIQPGRQAEFEDAIQRALRSVMSQAEGVMRYSVHKGIESPERYVLQIEWETLEHHTVKFREGPLFTKWREIIGPFFASAPVVEHFETVVSL